MKSVPYNMLPEDFREKIMKLDSVQAASIATDMMLERGNNVRKWKIQVYSDSSIESYSQMLLENKDEELKFWCYLNKDKSIVLTNIYKDGSDSKIGLSCTIDRFGDEWWFGEIESALKEQRWI